MRRISWVNTDDVGSEKTNKLDKIPEGFDRRKIVIEKARDYLILQRRGGTFLVQPSSR
jgi:hypothetical protein